MKLRILLFSILSVSCIQISQAQSSRNDKAAIEEVIREAYIQGVYNTGYTLSITQGFSPDFKAIIFEGQDQSRVETMNDWLKKAEAAKAAEKLPLQGKDEVSFRITSISISNTVAHVQLEFMVGGKVQHTDYIGLYHYSSGWRLVTMMYEEGH